MCMFSFLTVVLVVAIELRIVYARTSSFAEMQSVQIIV